MRFNTSMLPKAVKARQSANPDISPEEVFLRHPYMTFRPPVLGRVPEAYQCLPICVPFVFNTFDSSRCLFSKICLGGLCITSHPYTTTTTSQDCFGSQYACLISKHVVSMLSNQTSFSIFKARFVTLLLSCGCIPMNVFHSLRRQSTCNHHSSNRKSSSYMQCAILNPSWKHTNVPDNLHTHTLQFTF